MKCHEKVEKKIGNVFEKFGRFVARHPWKMIAMVIIVNGALGGGMALLKSDIDVSRVYTPMNSQAMKDEEIIQGIFPDKSGSDFYSYQLVTAAEDAVIYIKPNNGTVLDVKFLTEVEALADMVQKIVGDLDGEEVRFDDICTINSGQCVIGGSVFWSPDFINSVKAGSVSYPYFFLSSGVRVGLSSILSGVQTDSSGVLTSASHLKLTFYLRADSTDFILKTEAWQEKFTEVMKEYTSSEFDFAFAHSGSLGEEISGNIGGDIGLFSVTFTLMITYACAATYSAKHDCIGNRMFLGFVGVLAAGLAIVAAFGLVSLCGISFVSIVGNMPFLIIGIGVDDMFILLSGLSGAPYDGDTSNRIGRMMRTSGVAITITTLTDILAFAIGAASTFKSVRNFCLFTGAAVLFCYINQTVFFSACLAINEDRINGKRHFAVCCKKTKSKEAYSAENASSKQIFCCAGEPPKSRADVESILERAPRQFLSSFITKLPVKIIILIGFVIYLVFAIIGALNLKQGLVARNLVADDSYYYKFMVWKDNHFQTSAPVSFVMRDTLDYSLPETDNQISALLQSASENKFMSNSSISWLDTYMKSPFYNQTSFVADLQTFLKHPRYARFKNDVIIKDGHVTASRVYAFTVSIENSQDKGQMMLDMRDVAEKSPLNTIAFYPSFIFYEQYVTILPQTLQTLGLSIAAVFLITLLFMPHPLLLLYVVITMGMIMTGVVGFMHYWGLTLSSITMIHLIMSVGFSVDFTAHICHAFMVAEGDSRDERVKVALETSGGPIINGGFSSVLGILMLTFAKSYIFKSFFQVMLVVVLFGLGHAVLFLPVVLSFIGPSRSVGKPEQEKIQLQELEANSPENRRDSGNVPQDSPGDGNMQDEQVSPLVKKEDEEDGGSLKKEMSELESPTMKLKNETDNLLANEKSQKMVVAIM